MNTGLFVFAFVLSGLLHFGIQKVFIYFKKFDDFNHRSSHNTLATRTGGIGIFITVLIISLYYYFQGIELFDYSLFIPLGIMFVIGVYDDLYNADFKLKFILQIIVAKILIDQGYVISSYHGLFGLYEVPWLIAQLSTVFVFIVVVNAINFIDGIDGLAITEVIKTIILAEIFCSSMSTIFQLGTLTISSTLPLYYFNFKKTRKVFLGDGGSMLLGTIVMVYLLYILGPEYNLNKNYPINKVFFSIGVVLYPLFDLLRVFILRMKKGKSPFVADKRHIHHILLKKKLSHYCIVIAILTSQLLLIFSATIF